MLVDLDTCKAALNIDIEAHDENLENLLIPAASGAVLNYLKLDHEFYDDTSGNVVGVPDEVRNATVMLVGIMLRDPDGKDTSIWPDGYLPMPVKNLLYMLRDPSLA